MEQVTKRNHYLPQTYLKHFLHDDKLYRYAKGEKFFKPDIGVGKRLLEINGETALVNQGIIKGLYDPEIPGISPNDIEDIFSELGEQTYNELISELSNLDNGSPISNSQKERLSQFIASMRVRTPQFKFEVEDMDETLKKYKQESKFRLFDSAQMQSFLSEKFNKDISLEQSEEILDMIRNKRYRLKHPTNGFFIQNAIMAMCINKDIFQKMNFQIFRSTNRFFVTSDNPVSFFVPEQHLNFYTNVRSLGSEFVELYFPLTKNLGLFLSRRKNLEQIKIANREIVEIFNFNTMTQSFDYIFSPIKMNSVKPYVEKFHPFPFKFDIR